jgi:hypothetical protein
MAQRPKSADQNEIRQQYSLAIFRESLCAIHGKLDLSLKIEPVRVELRGECPEQVSVGLTEARRGFHDSLQHARHCVHDQLLLLLEQRLNIRKVHAERKALERAWAQIERAGKVDFLVDEVLDPGLSARVFFLHPADQVQREAVRLDGLFRHHFDLSLDRISLSKNAAVDENLYTALAVFKNSDDKKDSNKASDDYKDISKNGVHGHLLHKS